MGCFGREAVRTIFQDLGMGFSPDWFRGWLFDGTSKENVKGNVPLLQDVVEK
jgi:hypothetical protein